MGKDRKQTKKRGAVDAAAATSRGDFTPLAAHERQGNILHAPWTTYLKTEPASWARERLPEMLWAVLAISGPSHQLALALFRRTAQMSALVKDHEPKADITLTALGAWPQSARTAFFQAISEWPDTVPCLRPLLLFSDLPLRDEWAKAIGSVPEPEDWENLKCAVAEAFWHQSIKATEVRWLRFMFQLGCGRMKFVRGAIRENTLTELNNYPHQGDLSYLRPFVRASELMIDEMVDAKDRIWPEQFWHASHRDAACSRREPGTQPISPAGTTTTRIEEVRTALSAHALTQEKSTGVDARHNAVFGIGLFALAVLDELLRVGNDSAILGRFGLRSIVESYVTLSYLVSKDTEELWVSWRNYGAERAKLAFLKLVEDDTARYITPNALSDLANEDFWQELLPIRLGHWNASDLRSHSIEGGTKEDYDRYYDWTSAYAHGHWATIRDVLWETCANPLHRLHRIPRGSKRRLEDVVPDAARVVDLILELVGRCYQPFSGRVSVSGS